VVWSIVVAAGSGSRFGGPKQFEMLGGVPVVDRAVLAAAAASAGVVVVLPPSRPDWTPGPVGVELATVPGGATRSQSVRAGLARVPASAEVVVVHDAARPLASGGLFRGVIQAVLDGAAGAVPGLPVADTVKRVSRGAVVETLDRSALVLVQTPQAFSAAVLRQAHRGQAEGTDDASLVEALGHRVAVVPGEPGNAKITSPGDLAAAEWWLAAAGAEPDVEGRP
jgi:2-C-methyl-D-erythritol 4-phosphate cytidylyltransferase